VGKVFFNISLTADCHDNFPRFSHQVREILSGPPENCLAIADAVADKWTTGGACWPSGGEGGFDDI